ncbi:hypothetical protein HQQ82_00090 [Rathayibacter sp. VKM Ac-2856]|uniref:hypothetical protein n=1 Tax=unclassified Rathayibacter TaxID=2609250 RepID=UPI0015677AE6|nr:MULTISPECIES: hypothetical protein [unclassified Rathayibacter]NQX03194.1 hypothetical protein [Rathayibacter sp. VKM Ac-2858]NQX18362.1 hypothetical protein [Rathayibacter sp. VKM Ac-2856]
MDQNPAVGDEVVQAAQGGSIDVDTAAARAQAYIYGNIVVLGTLAVIGPAEAGTAENLLLLIGTVVSTFIAHVVAESYATRIRTNHRPDRAALRHSLRDGLPVLSSGAIPVVLLIAAVAGLLGSTAAFSLAALSVVTRFLLLGFTIGHLRGTQSSWRTVGTGVALATAGVATAGFKLVVGH